MTYNRNRDVLIWNSITEIDQQFIKNNRENGIHRNLRSAINQFVRRLNEINEKKHEIRSGTSFFYDKKTQYNVQTCIIWASCIDHFNDHGIFDGLSSMITEAFYRFKLIYNNGCGWVDVCRTGFIQTWFQSTLPLATIGIEEVKPFQWISKKIGTKCMTHSLKLTNRKTVDLL